MRITILALGFVLSLSSSAFSVIPAPNPLPFSADLPSLHKILGPLQTSSQSIDLIDTEGNFHNWLAFRYEISSGIGLAVGAPLRLASGVNDESRLRQAALTFVYNNAAVFNLDGLEPVIRTVHRALKMTVVDVEFYIQGVPVYSASLVLSVNPEGELALVKAQGYGSQLEGVFKLSAGEAELEAARLIGLPMQSVSSTKARLPRSSSDKPVLTACWKVDAATSHPAIQPTLFIDAENGKLLAAENRVNFIDLQGTTAGMYFPLYGRREPERGLFPYEWVNIAGADSLFTNADGSFEEEVEEAEQYSLNSLLRGRYAQIEEFDANNGALRIDTEGEAPVELLWNDENSRPDERNLYFHINRIHDHWKTIEPEFDRLDRPVIGVAGVGGAGFEQLEDNAMSAGLALFFGRGNRFDNFAHYADVIYHEYNHSVTGAVYGGHNLPYEGESGALNEGWSDYFACSLTNESAMGEGGLMGQNFMRNLNNNLMYPRDIEGEVHADGRIVGAAMWHTRSVLGRTLTDSLLHFARYHYAQDFRSYVYDVLLTDDDDGNLMNGTPHYVDIYTQFGRHGITPDLPHFIFEHIALSDDGRGGTEGNDNGLAEPGEIIGIDVSIFRAGSHIPFNDDPILITVETDNPHLDIVRQGVVIPALPLGESGSAQDLMLINILDDAPLSFAWLSFQAEGGAGEPVTIDSLRITLNRPRLLVVKDGAGGVDRTSYIHSSLDALGYVYTDLITARPFHPLSATLPIFQTVIWFTGEARQDILDESARQALGQYLDGGGNLLLTSQCAGEVRDAAGFFEQYLGAENTIDSLRGMQVVGVAGDPVSEGLIFLLSGVQSAMNQSRPGAAAGDNGGVEFMRWSRVEGEPAAGIRYQNPESGARSIYLTFGMEAIGSVRNMNNRMQVFARFLSWLRSPSAASEPEAMPQSFTLGAPYPNPFNNRVIMPFYINRQGRMAIRIFNPLGQTIYQHSQDFMPGGHNWSVDASNWSGGMYFVQVNAGTAESERVKLVLMK